ncbi:hypothetical protein Efla_006019 [Eimeria flavescens]
MAGRTRLLFCPVRFGMMFGTMVKLRVLCHHCTTQQTGVSRTRCRDPENAHESSVEESMAGLTLGVGLEERTTVIVNYAWKKPQDVRHRVEMEACEPLPHATVSQRIRMKSSVEENVTGLTLLVGLRQRATVTVADTSNTEPHDARHRVEMEASRHKVIVLPDSIWDDVWDDGEITCVVPPLHHTADCKTSDEERKYAHFDVLAQ